MPTYLYWKRKVIPKYFAKKVLFWNSFLMVPLIYSFTNKLDFIYYFFSCYSISQWSAATAIYNKHVGILALYSAVYKQTKIWIRKGISWYSINCKGLLQWSYQFVTSAKPPQGDCTVTYAYIVGTATEQPCWSYSLSIWLSTNALLLVKSAINWNYSVVFYLLTNYHHQIIGLCWDLSAVALWGFQANARHIHIVKSQP